MTDLIHSVFIGSPGLVAKGITLENTAREQTGSGLDNICSDIFLRESINPNIVANNRN